MKKFGSIVTLVIVAIVATIVSVQYGQIQDAKTALAQSEAQVTALQADLAQSEGRVAVLQADLAKLEVKATNLAGESWADYYETTALIATLASLIESGTTFQVERDPWGPVMITKLENGWLQIEVSRPWPSTVRPSSGTFDQFGNFISPTYGGTWNVPILGTVTSR